MMDISKLKRQFLREARSSPKKLAVLALVMAIAVWRIAPLVSGMFSSGQEDLPQTAAQAAPAVRAIGQDHPPAAVPTSVGPSWRELDSQISSDPLMQSADLSGWKNPFGDVAPPIVVAEVTTADEPEAAAVALPTSELVLSSTVVGTRRRTALINGRTYAEGDLLDQPGAPIKVVSIRPRSVLVDSQGAQTELTIAQQPVSPRIQVRRESSVTRSMNGPEG